MDKSFKLKASVTVEYTIPLSRFPSLFQHFLEGNPKTIDLEKLGLSLREQNFEHSQISDFVKGVCEWGGDYRGIAKQVLRKNTLDRIANALQNATTELSKAEPDFGKALQMIDDLKGLGVSFGSKHLRFLFPDKCPVLDSRISNRLFYSSDCSGYNQFVRDCNMIVSALEGIDNLVPERKGKWYVADVEASLYTYLKKEPSSTDVKIICSCPTTQ